MWYRAHFCLKQISRDKADPTAKLSTNHNQKIDMELFRCLIFILRCSLCHRYSFSLSRVYTIYRFCGYYSRHEYSIPHAHTHT